MIDTKFFSSPTNVEVYKEDDRYYMRFDCPYEDNSAYYNLHIDKISFGIILEHIYSYIPPYGNKKEMKARFKTGEYDSHGDGTYTEFELNPDKDKNYFTLTKIKDKVKEITMDEIEQKFGCKVKIVNKENGE